MLLALLLSRSPSAAGFYGAPLVTSLGKRGVRCTTARRSLVRPRTAMAGETSNIAAAAGVALDKFKVTELREICR
jgi:hypothetical protein